VANDELRGRFEEVLNCDSPSSLWASRIEMLDALLAQVAARARAAEHKDATDNFIFWAVRLLEEEYGGENCGDHCRNSCRWCGLRNAVTEAKERGAELQKAVTGK